ncbi:MAG: anti-sigma factor family protein [Acidimicrobiales bacterium]
MTYRDVACRDYVELATDYLEGALSSEDRLTVELHLAFCRSCVDYLDQMRATIAVAGSLREDDVPQPVVASLVKAFRTLSARRDGADGE